MFADLVAYTEIAGNSGGSYALFDDDGKLTVKLLMVTQTLRPVLILMTKGFNLTGSVLTLDAGADAGNTRLKSSTQIWEGIHSPSRLT